ncbi:hypothetical protein AeRB84_016431, partial [Aphanomyces euteiches]
AKDFDQLLHKEIDDGTQRRTLSINMEALDPAVAARCPSFAAAHEKYSAVIDQATTQFASALDSMNTDLSSDLLLPIVQEGKHLDHVHHYTKAISMLELSEESASSPTLSLDLHADAGLFIVFAKSHYFEHVDGKATEVTNVDHAGLVIEVDGQLVQPVLDDNELYFMAGEGTRLWGSYGHKFHPVVHGMIMPSSITSSVARMFAGRMLLLPPNRVMANTGLKFEEYTNATPRHLMNQPGVESIMALACPVGRILRASDSSCTLHQWGPGEGSTATKEQCMRQCNIWSHADEAQKCLDMKCVKTGDDIPDGGNDCWMMCIAHLSSAQCPAPGVEKCDADNRVLNCVGGAPPPPPPTSPPTPPPTPPPTSPPTSMPTSKPPPPPTTRPTSPPDTTTTPVPSPSSNPPSSTATPSVSPTDSPSPSTPGTTPVPPSIEPVTTPPTVDPKSPTTSSPSSTSSSSPSPSATPSDSPSTTQPDGSPATTSSGDQVGSDNTTAISATNSSTPNVTATIEIDVPIATDNVSSSNEGGAVSSANTTASPKSTTVQPKPSVGIPLSVSVLSLLFLAVAVSL